MRTKRCVRCGKVKPISEFYKHKKMADGYRNICKDCINKQTREKKGWLKWDKTEKRVIRAIYKVEVRSSKQRNMPLPAYTRQELKEWLYKHNFKELYDKWVDSGYNKYLKPSVDRLNDFKPYTFSNIRLVTWKDNLLHQTNNRRNHIGKEGGKKRKIVRQYSLDRKLLAVYPSIHAAARAINGSFENIRRTCKKDSLSAYGYKWKCSNV